MLSGLLPITLLKCQQNLELGWHFRSDIDEVNKLVQSLALTILIMILQQILIKGNCNTSNKEK